MLSLDIFMLSLDIFMLPLLIELFDEVEFPIELLLEVVELPEVVELLVEFDIFIFIVEFEFLFILTLTLVLSAVVHAPKAATAKSADKAKVFFIKI